MNRFLVVTFWLIGFVLFAGCTRQELDQPEVGVTTRAFWLAADKADLPPSGGAAWQATVLPFHLQEAGRVWLRVPLPAPASRVAQAIYLPDAGFNAELWLNGRFLGSRGQRQPPLTRQFYTPLLFPVEADLWRADGRNELHVLIAGERGQRVGMAEVFVGPRDRLEANWLMRGWMQASGSIGTGLLGILLGLYVMARWWRSRDLREFAWFGLVFVIWGMRSLNLGLAQGPISGEDWLRVTSLTTSWSSVLFGLFAILLSESEDKNYRASRYAVPFMLVYGALVSVLVFLLDAETLTGPNMRWAIFIGVVITLLGQIRILLLAIQVRRYDLWVPALFVAIYVGIAFEEYLLGPARYPLPDHLARQYESAPLFLAAGWLLARRYLRALVEARALSGSLQEQVAAQHRQIQQNFERLRLIEREQAGSDERQRMMRDLHDSLGLHLNTALRQVRQPDTPREAVTETLMDCLDDLRVAIDSLDTGESNVVVLLGTLRYRMAPRFESLGIKLSWRIDPDLPELPDLDPESALQLLRIAQEALGNAMKHSGASEVTLSVALAGAERLRIEVTDNGRGLPDDISNGRGFGNMRARAKRLGGELLAENPEVGTRLTLSLPFDPGKTAA
jgi:signal transduction histidine kinase